MGIRRGVVLGVVVFVSIILAVFIFSYNNMVRQQNIRAHHEMIGEVGGMLALTGVHLLYQQIESNFDSLILGAAPTIISAIPTTASLTLTAAHPICQDVQTDFNLLLAQLPHLVDNSVIPARSPKCLAMDISFEKMTQISPDTDAPQFQAGRDPVEKCGEVVVSCLVEHRGLKRRAEIRRQFRVVSMVPGIISRFSLFVPFTPWPHSYNGIGVAYNGAIDPTYVHPLPTPRTYSNPLKVFNGTDTSSGIIDDLLDLRNRGWIFLGPVTDPATAGVMLKIPSGFDHETGGHYLFCLPPNIVSGKEVVRPERIDDPAHFDVPPPSVASYMIGGLFQGFFTSDPGLAPNQIQGAAGYNLWTGLLANPGTGWTPNDRWYCASSWLFPFGDRDNPSRTLILGPVLAGFLKMYFLKDNLNNPPAWKTIIKGVAEPTYNPASLVPILNVAQKDLFKLPADPDPKAGYQSYLRVMPANSDANPGGFPPTQGTAFNVLFDFMKYPPVGSPYPVLEEGSSALGNVTNPFFVPNATAMKNPTSGIKGLHPYDSVRIFFREHDGTDPNTAPDNCYFSGDLKSFRFSNQNLLARVTHILDLRDCHNQLEEDDQVRDFVFRPATAADHPPPGSNWLVPKHPGIFYFKRRSSVSSGGDKLKLPPRIFLSSPLVLVFERGDVEIPGRIESKLLGGAPEQLCSLVALEGDLYLNTTDQVHAYLIALNPGPGGNGGGGRLLSGNPPPFGSVRRMDLFGGLACWEMGLWEHDTRRTTMGDFSDGGVIRYNPRFNPSSDLYPTSRVFVMEDRPSQILVRGGE